MKQRKSRRAGSKAQSIFEPAQLHRISRKAAMNQTAAMSVDEVAVAGPLELNPDVAVWFVSEDENGLYRKFPQHLNVLVEQQFVQWKQSGSPPDSGVEYYWTNAIKTRVQKYEITFDDMRQKNMNTNKVRAVERYVCCWLEPNPVVAVWFVSEDERGRYRKFPQHLNDRVEQEFLQWKQGGSQPGFGVEYDWPNASKTSSQKYEITFEDMRQKNMNTNKIRAVERYVCC